MEKLSFDQRSERQIESGPSVPQALLEAHVSSPTAALEEALRPTEEEAEGLCCREERNATDHCVTSVPVGAPPFVSVWQNPDRDRQCSPSRGERGHNFGYVAWHPQTTCPPPRGGPGRVHMPHIMVETLGALGCREHPACPCSVLHCTCANTCGAHRAGAGCPLSLSAARAVPLFGSTVRQGSLVKQPTHFTALLP